MPGTAAAVEGAPPTSAEVVYLHALPYGGSAATRDPGLPSYPVIPVGVPGLLNLLRAEGYAVVGSALALERLDPGFDLATWLASTGARLVLLDLHWYEHAHGVREAAATARQALPAARIVVGGMTAAAFAPQVLQAIPALDAIIAGDAERPLLAVARAAVRGEPWPPAVANTWVRDPAGAPVAPRERYRTPAETLDALDAVDLGWLRHADAYRRMVYSLPRRGLAPPATGRGGQWLPTGRGCAFRCSYCGGGRDAHERLAGLRGLLKRDPAGIAADCRRLAERGVQQAAPSLDPDMFGRAHLGALLAALRDAPPPLGYYVESYQLPSRQLLDGLGAVALLEHTELALTPLSGDERVRRWNGKGYSNQELLDCLADLAARDLSVFVFFSLNLPGEDGDTLDATLDLARRIVDGYPPGRLRMIDICHTLDPASPLLADPAAFDVARVTLRSFADYLEHGARAAAGEPAGLDQARRGFVVEGRDLGAMAARWDALAAQYPGTLVPVPPA